MAQKKQTAFVVVSKEWMNTAVCHLINRGRESRSTGDTHLIIADLDDATDSRGVWLKNITTDRLKSDGSNVTMRFMIPWGVIVALGLAEHGTQVQPGFVGDVGFEAADLTDQSTRQSEEN